MARGGYYPVYSNTLYPTISISLQCTALPYSVFHCPTLHFTALHCTEMFTNYVRDQRWEGDLTMLTLADIGGMRGILNANIGGPEGEGWSYK